MDFEKYERVKQEILQTTRERKGIGTLSEKTIHAILKAYYATSEEEVEVHLEGKVVDIYNGKEVIEIQTRSFEKLRGKLEVLLPKYQVALVYPIPRKKYVIWINEETGEMSKPRKSPQTGSEYFIFKELYKIKQFLTHENLQLKIVLMDMEEFRLLNGWSKDKKKGSTRFDRVPLTFVQETIITSMRDYVQLIPCELEEPFTVKDFAKVAKIKRELAQVVIHILASLGIISHIGKQGKAYLYEMNEL
ncbi:MAG: hypothetical protein R3Y54_06740 [Eubacteriales bacterium]